MIERTRSLESKLIGCVILSEVSVGYQIGVFIKKVQISTHSKYKKNLSLITTFPPEKCPDTKIYVSVYKFISCLYCLSLL